MLSKKLAELRKETGLSQMELAEKLDVTRQAVSRWETGDAAPSLENLISLGDLYGVTIDDLVRDDKPVPDAPTPDPVPTEAAPPKPARPGHKIWAFVLTAALFFAALALFIGTSALPTLPKTSTPPETSLPRPTEPGPGQAVPPGPYTADLEQFDPPFAATADLLPAFTAEKRDFLEAPARHSLTARGLGDREYASSEETYSLPAAYTRLTLQCTWGGYADVWVGLRNTRTGEVHTLRLAGRSATGSLALAGLPAGEYQVILYGGYRFEPDPLAVMWYQFQ